MTIEQRYRQIPLTEGAKNVELEDEVQRVLPDWQRSFERLPGIEDYVHMETSFSRDFGSSMVTLKIGRNNQDDKINVEVEIERKDRTLSNDFQIHELASANIRYEGESFIPYMRFHGMGTSSNEEIQISNWGLVSVDFLPLESNVSATLVFQPIEQLY